MRRWTSGFGGAELSQHAVGEFRVKERDEFAGGALEGDLVNQFHASTGGLRELTGDIGRGESDVMHAAGRHHAMRKPFGDENCTRHAINISVLFSLLPPPPGRIVEFGCGTGWLSLILAERGYEVVGIDISPDAIVIAEQLRQSGRQAEALILEPVGRNTAPALTLAALHLTRAGADCVMLVMPAASSCTT